MILGPKDFPIRQNHALIGEYSAFIFQSRRYEIHINSAEKQQKNITRVVVHARTFCLIDWVIGN